MLKGIEEMDKKIESDISNCGANKPNVLLVDLCIEN
jgi:hypothetical protein